MKKFLVLGVVVIAIGAVAWGSAATLNVKGGTIQYGEDLDLTCANKAQVAGWGLETDDNTVNFVRFENLPAKCEGNTIFVNITQDGTKIAGGSAEITSSWNSGNNSKVYFDPQNAADITDLEVWIEGGSP